MPLGLLAVRPQEHPRRQADLPEPEVRLTPPDSRAETDPMSNLTEATDRQAIDAAVQAAVKAIREHTDSGRTTDPRIAVEAIDRALAAGGTYEDINRGLYPR